MTRRKQSVQADILEGLQGAVDFLKGKSGGGRTHVIMVPDVGGLRRSLKLSQAGFAKNFGIPKRTLQDWEQGVRVPDQAARSYLTVIANNPKAVRKALSS